MLPSQRDVNFVFYICCSIVPFGAGGHFFFSPDSIELLIFFSK